MTDSGMDFTIDRLGECHVPSPMTGARFVGDGEMSRGTRQTNWKLLPQVTR